MTLSDEYRGQEVEVWTTELIPGRFNSAYTIDGQQCTEGTNRTLSSDQVALADGVAAVRARIDSYRYLGSPS